MNSQGWDDYVQPQTFSYPYLINKCACGCVYVSVLMCVLLRVCSCTFDEMCMSKIATAVTLLETSTLCFCPQGKKNPEVVGQHFSSEMCSHLPSHIKDTILA